MEKTVKGSKRLLLGIVIIVLGIVLLKIASILSWALIIAGAIIVLMGMGKLRNSNKLLEEIEKNLKPKRKL